MSPDTKTGGLAGLRRQVEREAAREAAEAEEAQAREEENFLRRCAAAQQAAAQALVPFGAGPVTFLDGWGEEWGETVGEVAVEGWPRRFEAAANMHRVRFRYWSGDGECQINTPAEMLAYQEGRP